MKLLLSALFVGLLSLGACAHLPPVHDILDAAEDVEQGIEELEGAYELAKADPDLQKAKGQVKQAVGHAESAVKQIKAKQYKDAVQSLKLASDELYAAVGDVKGDQQLVPIYNHLVAAIKKFEEAAKKLGI